MHYDRLIRSYVDCIKEHQLAKQSISDNGKTTLKRRAKVFFPGEHAPLTPSRRFPLRCCVARGLPRVFVSSASIVPTHRRSGARCRTLAARSCMLWRWRLPASMPCRTCCGARCRRRLDTLGCRTASPCVRVPSLRALAVYSASVCVTGSVYSSRHCAALPRAPLRPRALTARVFSSRVRACVAADKTDEQIEKAINENPQGFAREALLAEAADEQVQQVYSEVKSRARDVEMLAASIREVHEMFQDFATLLAQQHDQIDQIETTVRAWWWLARVRRWRWLARRQC